jgi:CHAD domain-containing protein
MLESTIPENVTRIVNEQIDRAVAELTDKSLEPLVAIHQARKRIKKIRAVIRLVRKEMGDFYSYENLLFRDMGRKLADIRDAQAALETFEKLGQRFPAHFMPGAYARARIGLKKHRQTTIGNKSYLEKLISEVVDALQYTRKRLVFWPLTTDHFSAMDMGYRKTYRGGRRLFNQALLQAASPENLHELRKAVKYHWYHSRLLCKIHSKCMSRYNTSVKKMADLLGEHHDMALLHSMLLKHPERYGTYHEIMALLELIDRRKKELWEQTKPLGNLIFLEKPRIIEKRMLEKWEEWKQPQDQCVQANDDNKIPAADKSEAAILKEISVVNSSRNTVYLESGRSESASG